MKNFKTTLAAFIGFAIILVNKYSGLDLPEEIVVGLVITGVALFTKDYDTTGIGTEATKKD